jgi:hypothetical protein
VAIPGIQRTETSLTLAEMPSKARGADLLGTDQGSAPAWPEPVAARPSTAAR